MPANTAYWIVNPLDKDYLSVLRNKAREAIGPYDYAFETAYLIAIDCLEKDGMTLTAKGWDALEYYKRIKP